MPARTRLPALLAPCLLLACANETVIPQATDMPAERPTQVAPPAAPVTEFDGRYVGTVTLNPDRTRACPAAPAGQREITVRQGRASLLINPSTRQILRGTVGSAGDVRMSDSLDRTIATSGIFDNGLFLGEHRNGRCSYAVRMTKRD
jgi:hypothetical protein